MTVLRVNSVQHLKELASSKREDFFILLRGGLRSSKNILWDEADGLFCINHEIDDTHQDLTEADGSLVVLPLCSRLRWNIHALQMKFEIWN